MLPIIAAAPLFLVAAPAASAAPLIDYVSCESGGNDYVCEMSYTGAVGAVTVQWNAYTQGVYLYTTYGTTTGKHACTTGKVYNFDLFVTDSTGTTSTTTAVTCRSGPWQ